MGQHSANFLIKLSSLGRELFESSRFINYLLEELYTVLDATKRN
jgi:hypothetical protein